MHFICSIHDILLLLLNFVLLYLTCTMCINFVIRTVHYDTVCVTCTCIMIMR